MPWLMDMSTGFWGLARVMKKSKVGRKMVRRFIAPVQDAYHWLVRKLDGGTRFGHMQSCFAQCAIKVTDDQ